MSDLYSERSGRLRVIEKLGPVEGGKFDGMMQVLCLCACGNTKRFLLRDFRIGRAQWCNKCKRIEIIRPHFDNQETRQENKGVRHGPPQWDPLTRRGVFKKDFVK